MHHQVQVADVDAELQGRCGDDGGVAAGGEALLGLGPICARNRAVMDEDFDAATLHRGGDTLGAGAALDKDEAFAPEADLGCAAGERGDVFDVVDVQFALRRRLWWVDQDAVAFARAAEPIDQDVRVADRRREADPLDVCTGDVDETLEQGDQVRAAVVVGEGVDLVDDPCARCAASRGRRAWPRRA